MSNPIKSFTDNEGTNWHYFEGSFWAVSSYSSGTRYLLACPAMANGTPDINDGAVNACDVECCEQRHIDFVNDVFGTDFSLTAIHEESGEGRPVYRKKHLTL